MTLCLFLLGFEIEHVVVDRYFRENENVGLCLKLDASLIPQVGNLIPLIIKGSEE